MEKTVNVDTFYDGTKIAGVDVGGKTQEEAIALLNDVAKEQRDPVDITVTFEGKEQKITEDDFEYSYTTEQVVKEAWDYARSGDKYERYEKITALEEKPVEYEIENSIQEKSIEEVVKKIADEMDIDAVDAKVTSFDVFSDPKFTYKEGSNGIVVDREKLIQEITDLLSGAKTGTIEAPGQKTESKVSVAQLKERTKLISSFTTVSTNTYNGTHNMKLALAATNGTVLQPGEVFSFNGTTGDTTNGSLGYLPAGAISGGKTVQEYGGGICQASTTIYGAALRADMEIVSRYNHLWPSSYVPIGQDATVSYPYLDFQFKNSSKYAIYIGAYMTGQTLHVEIYGYQPEDWDKIEVTSKTTEVIPMPKATTKVDNSLKPGQKVVDISGNQGYRASGQKVFYKNGQVVKTEAIHSSYYRPVAPVYKVGPSSDSSGNNDNSDKDDKPSSSSQKPSSSSQKPSSKPQEEDDKPASSSKPDTSTSSQDDKPSEEPTEE